MNLYRLIAVICLCWQDVDIDLKKSNQESLQEAGCLLLCDEIVPSSEVPSRYTRIRNLQRLKVSSLIDGSEINAIIINLFVNLEFCVKTWERINQHKTKHTNIVFLGGTHFCHLPLLHLCQHGWRSRRKTRGDSWETTCLQTRLAWTSPVSLSVHRLEPWLSLPHRDFVLHWDWKFCCLDFKYSVTLFPNKQRIYHCGLHNFMEKNQYPWGIWQSWSVWWLSAFFHQ